VQVDDLDLEAVTPEEGAAAADGVVIITDHAAFDYAEVVARAALIVDTRNALKGFRSEKIVRL
jgi:UDP-N-acetyl-D-glucosamine dehydrogenase